MVKMKVLMMLACTMTVSSAVIACSSGSSQVTATGTNGTPQKKEPVTITFWHSYNETSPEAKTLTDVLIPKFESAHPDIQVKAVVMPYDQMQQKLLTSAAGGSLPDCARLDIIWSPQLAKLGVLLPEDSLPGFSDLKSKVFAGPLSTNLYEGKYYGLPLDTNTKVLMYNPDNFAKAGIADAPKTMDEFVEDINKLSSGSGSTATFGYASGTDMWSLLPWIWSYGAEVLSPDMKKASGYINSPETVHAVQQLVDLVKAHKVAGFSNGEMPTSDGLAKGKYAIIDDGPWMYPIYEKQYPNFKMKTALYPAGPKGGYEVVGGENFGIFATDKAHQDAAWEFEKFMLDTDAQVAMAKVGQMPVIQDLINNPDIKAIPSFGIFLEQLKSSKARPPVPQYGKINDALKTAVTQAVGNQKSVKDALDEAAKKCDSILTQ